MWDILGIEKTTDQRKIKRSYARLVAKYHPEEEPDKFQEIQQAYERALRYARFCKEREEEEQQEHILQKTSEKEAIFQQKMILSQLTEKGPENSSQNNSVNFESYNWIDGEPEEKVIRRLLHQVEHLMYSENVIRIEAWERILQSEEFQKHHLANSFYIPFCRLIDKPKYPMEIAETIINNVDISGIQREYGYEEEERLEMRLWRRANKYEERNKRQSMKYTSKKDGVVTGHYYEGFIIPKLLVRFQKLIDGESFKKVEAWDELLQSDEFKRYYLHETFFEPFLCLLESKTLTPKVRERIYWSMNMVEVQIRYGNDSYNRMKRVLNRTRYSSSETMSKSVPEVILATFGKVLGFWYLFRVLLRVLLSLF